MNDESFIVDHYMYHTRTKRKVKHMTWNPIVQ